MSRALSLLVCAGLLAGMCPAELLAEESIVTINFNSVVIQTSEAQKQLGVLQAKFAPRQAQLKALNDDVETLRKELGSDSAKLSDADRAAHEQSLENKERQLQRQAEDFRTDSQNESQEVLQAVSQKVYAFLQKYAQQHGYSVVIERGSDTAPVVWYAADNLDITQELVKAYNEQLPAAPAASPAKPTKTLPGSSPLHQ
jgi:outer membrane protein